MYETPLTGLVLSGGGARAAYQVGVLRAMARMRREALGPRRALRNPFGVICGTSAGAINAAALACHADRFDAAVEVHRQGLAELQCRAGLPRRFAGRDPQRRAVADDAVDGLGASRAGAARGRARCSTTRRWPTCCSAWCRWSGCRACCEQRHLHALAVTASSYTQRRARHLLRRGAPIEPWTRSQRVAVPTRLTHDAPAGLVGDPLRLPGRARSTRRRCPSWFGDGSMRQTAPLSPAIHLGAQRLLVIGAGRMHEPPGAAVVPTSGYPSLAQIAGHALSSIFLDALAVDVERMQRINRTLALLPESALADTPLRPIEALVIAPTQRLDDIAARHLGAPAGAGARAAARRGRRRRGRRRRAARRWPATCCSRRRYTRELMALGEADTLARRDEVLQLLRLGRGAPAGAARRRRAGRRRRRRRSGLAAAARWPSGISLPWRPAPRLSVAFGLGLLGLVGLRGLGAASAGCAARPSKGAPATVSPACERRAALPGPTPPTRSTRSAQFLKLAGLAGLDDLGRQAGADALDGLEVGAAGLVGVDGGEGVEGEGGERRAAMRLRIMVSLLVDGLRVRLAARAAACVAAWAGLGGILRSRHRRVIPPRAGHGEGPRPGAPGGGSPGQRRRVSGRRERARHGLDARRRRVGPGAVAAQHAARCGPQARHSAGSLGPSTDSSGAPTAAAMWPGPVSLEIISAASLQQRGIGAQAHARQQQRAGEVLARDRPLRPARGRRRRCGRSAGSSSRHEGGEGRPGLVLLVPGAAGKGADDDAAAARCRARRAAPRPASRCAGDRRRPMAPGSGAACAEQRVAEVPVDLELVHAARRAAAARASSRLRPS